MNFARFVWYIWFFWNAVYNQSEVSLQGRQFGRLSTPLSYKAGPRTFQYWYIKTRVTNKSFIQKNLSELVCFHTVLGPRDQTKQDADL